MVRRVFYTVPIAALLLIFLTLGHAVEADEPHHIPTYVSARIGGL